MPRRPSYIATQWLPALSRIEAGWKRETAAWLYTLARRTGHLDYDIVEAHAAADASCPIRRQMTKSEAHFAKIGKRLTLQRIIRALTCNINGVQHRVLVSAMVDDRRQLVPVPFLVTRPEMMQELRARSEIFQNSWRQHWEKLEALQHLTGNYWR